MNAAAFFLATDGRLRRRDVWVGALALGVAAAGAVLVLLPVLGARLTSLAVNAALLWPLVGLGAKRLRDRGRSPWPWLALYLGPAALLTVLEHLEIGYYWVGGIAYPTGLWPNMLSLFATVIGAYGAAENLLMPGQAGRNEHGPDPRIVTE